MKSSKTISNSIDDNAPTGSETAGFGERELDRAPTEGVPADNGDDIAEDKGNKGTTIIVQTPTEIARQKYFNSQADTEKSKTAFWNSLKIICTVFGAVLTLVIAVLGIYWAYNLSNIAEPIGGIKEGMENLKKRDDEISNSIQKNDQRIDSIMNQLLSNKLSESK